jgi:hypothetical protein
MTKALCAVCLVCLTVIGVHAQQDCSASCSVLTGESFTALTDAAIGPKPVLLLDGQVLNVPLVTADGLHQFRIAGLTQAGAHAFMIQAGDKQTDTMVLNVVDRCAADPLIFRVTRWPASTVGSRRVDYTSNRPVQIVLDVRNSLWRATATDARGCQILQTR